MTITYCTANLGQKVWDLSTQTNMALVGVKVVLFIEVSSFQGVMIRGVMIRGVPLGS